MSAVRLTALVRGRVQMVGFRVFAEQVAAQIERERKAEISGWVRNLADGASVEIVAEGERSELEALLEELRIGPPMALVRAVEVEWGEAVGGLGPFGLRY